MLKLSLPDWVRNAVVALSGHYGDVTQRAEQADCSRQTVYNHAHQLVELVEHQPHELETLRAELAQVKAERDQLRQQLQEAVVLGDEQFERFAVTSQAMGVSLRQAEELLETVVPPDRVPDHSTLGRWTLAAGKRAGEVLAELDPLCVPVVRTLAVDEIFLGAWRRWWRSSRRAW